MDFLKVSLSNIFPSLEKREVPLASFILSADFKKSCVVFNVF